MKLSEIKNELKKMLMQFSVVKTDKAVLTYDAEELAVGVSVKIENEDGTFEIPTGDYVMEDGRTLVVENGEIKEIIEAPEVEPIEEVEETETEVVEEMAEVEPIEEETEPKTEETPEVEPETAEEVPALEDRITELEAKLAELEGLVAKLTVGAEEMLSAIEKMSLAKPITEEFENVKTVKKTGVAKVDKFLEKYGNK